jgi:hypothetical protein
VPAERPMLLDRALSLARVDFNPSHRQPALSWVAAALAVSVVGSLAADAILVAIGTRVFPSTKGYVHFQFHDYARLTIIGVVIACLAWPVATRISSCRAGCSSAWPSWSPWRSGCRTSISFTGARQAAPSPS